MPFHPSPKPYLIDEAEFDFAPMGGVDDVRLVGGSYVPKQIAQAEKEHGSRKWLWVALVPEPENPHAPGTAVRADLIVKGRAFKCGYLDREALDYWGSAVYAMHSVDNTVPVFPGNIWHGDEGDALSVYAWLAPPAAVRLDPSRGRARYLLPEHELTVRSSADQREHIRRLAPRLEDGTGAFELGFAADSDTERIQVRSDGIVLGELSQVMAERFRPTVVSTAASGSRTMAWGSIDEESGKPKLRLSVTSYSALDKGWSPWLYHPRSMLGSRSLVLANQLTTGAIN